MTADPDLVAGVREFLQKRLTLPDLATLLRAGGWDPELLHDLEDLGWSQLAADVDHDGLGMRLPDLGELMILVGERLAPGPLAERLLLPAFLTVPSLAAGSVPTVAFADPAMTVQWALESGALRMEDGRLRGTVSLVRHAPRADYLLLAVDSAEDSSTAIVLLPVTDPAVTVMKLTSSDPTASYGTVTVKRREVAKHEVISGGPAAVSLLTQLRCWSRIFAACELAGIASRVLNDSVAYAEQRRQFGRPVGSFQAIKHILAGMATSSASLRALAMATLHDAESSSVPDLELASWTLKAYAARCARQVCEDGLQVHGGIGFTQDHHLHWFIRRALALRTWYGDERELAELIGMRRLEAT
jgi:alkylation response protein AidB-like acyl-CoA dehydrogenase